MTIISSAGQSVWSRYVRQEPASRQGSAAQGEKTERKADARQTWMEEARRVAMGLQAFRTGKEGSGLQVRSLIDKFKTGKKLTPAEMAYLRKHASDEYETIERISREREVVEWGMRAAVTKQDVDHVVLLSSRHALKKSASEADVVRAAQFRDAHYQYMQTEEYREKPNHPWEDRKRSSRTRYIPENNNIRYNTMAIFAYEKAKQIGRRPLI